MLPGSAQSIWASSAAMRCCARRDRESIWLNCVPPCVSVVAPCLSAYTLKDMEARYRDTVGEAMMETGPFELQTQVLGPLPVINSFADRLGLPRLLDTYVPADDARLRLTPATALGVVVANLVIGHEPVYALGEWARPFDPALLGLGPNQADLLNDDRTGRMPARLFDADRASLLTRLVLDAVARFDVDLTQLHNDSTSIRFSGSYHGGDGHTRGGKPTARLTRGHSKDHRPDLKQLVWILTITADGAVPIAYRVADGNTVDDPVGDRD